MQIELDPYPKEFSIQLIYSYSTSPRQEIFLDVRKGSDLMLLLGKWRRYLYSINQHQPQDYHSKLGLRRLTLVWVSR